MRLPHRLAALALLVLACHGPAQRPAGPALRLDPAEPERADWTHAFLKASVLVADEIVIEGPPGLIEHVVLRADPEANDYATRTVPQGLLQELVARPGAHVELHAQLDAWSLAAFRRITVLQRPAEVPVSVRASGDAFFAAGDGSGERREAQLLFQGVRGK